MQIKMLEKESRRKINRVKPKFMALSALGRSRVMRATPFWSTFPLTRSSAISAKLRRVEWRGLYEFAEDRDEERRKERVEKGE